MDQLAAAALAGADEEPELEPEEELLDEVDELSLAGAALEEELAEERESVR
ncbi:hypothetical protein [Georgenia soli]|uniref:hypothetical protein n=1 Tax=Georgenia soli TaxID=638953 RepID=UPI001FE8309A|nr:hypothetical protein [Georgenia soli]